MKLLYPALAAGAVTVAVLAVTHMRHKKQMQHMRVPIHPPSPGEIVQHIKLQIELYIHKAALDPFEVQRKGHFIRQAVHEHCMRMFHPHTLHHLGPHHIKHKAIGIAEKVCHQLHVQLKPRCDDGAFDVSPRGVGHIGGINHAPHKAYAVNIYQLDFNHTPIPSQGGVIY